MRYLFAVAAAVFAVGCGDGGTEPKDPRAEVAGSYQLRTVNSGAVPVTMFQNSAGRVEIASGSMVLRTDGSFTEKTVVRATYTNGTPSSSTDAIDNGTFTVTGSQITFSIPPSGGNGGVSWTGAVSGNVVTYTYDGNAFRYEKN